MKNSRRNFIKKTALGVSALPALGFISKSNDSTSLSDISNFLNNKNEQTYWSEVTNIFPNDKNDTKIVKNNILNIKLVSLFLIGEKLNLKLLEEHLLKDLCY